MSAAAFISGRNMTDDRKEQRYVVMSDTNSLEIYCGADDSCVSIILFYYSIIVKSLCLLAEKQGKSGHEEVVRKMH